MTTYENDDSSYDDSGSESGDCGEIGNLTISPNTVVELGYGKKLSDYDAYLFQPHFFPTGKLGGKPSWLAYDPLPDVDDKLTCKTCTQPLILLMQLYSPQAATDAFHRTIYVFICPTPECCVAKKSDNLVVLRCQLPKDNPYHSADRAFNAEEDGPLAMPDKTLNDFNSVCDVCGCLGDKKCGKCQTARYCSRAHQMWHWKTGGHRNVCGKTGEECVNVETVESPLFKEFMLDTRPEMRRSKHKSVKTEAQRIAEYQEYMRKNEAQLGEFKNVDMGETAPKETKGGKEENVGSYTTPDDKVFDAFQEVLADNPKQVMRYDRNGTPLLASALGKNEQPTACALCGAKRTFEFQITPYTISLLDLDRLGASIDFGTILVYTCSKDCAVSGQENYAVEQAIKQDFDA